MSLLNSKTRLLLASIALLLIVYYLAIQLPIRPRVFPTPPASPILLAEYLAYLSLFSFDLDDHHAPRWMTALPSTTNLTSLSIPGTHDSLTAFINGPNYQCQNYPLTTQLEAGIRYFDIRARLQNNELQIYHQDSYTNHSYPEVLLTLFDFLDTNPGEMVLMRLKEESTPINSTVDFLTAFNYYRLNSSVTSAGCAEHFYIPPTPTPTVLPTLGDLRSKILILQNFDSPSPGEYGLPWDSPLIALEDYWEIPNLQTLDVKFEAVTQNLLAAGNGTEDKDGKLYLSHLSASVGVLPIEAAAGNRNGTVVGVNDRVGSWLKGVNGGATGVVIVDFPGTKLVQEVLKRNG